MAFNKEINNLITSYRSVNGKSKNIYGWDRIYDDVQYLFKQNLSEMENTVMDLKVLKVTK